VIGHRDDRRNGSGQRLLTAWLWVLLAVLILLLSAYTARAQSGCEGGVCPAPRSWDDRQRPVDPKIVRICYYEGPQGPFSYASGVICGRRDGTAYVLSCSHGYVDRMPVRVRLFDGRECWVREVIADRAQDVALLTIEDPGIHPAKMAQQQPAAGDRFLVAGWAQAKTFRWRSGRLRRWVSFDDGKHFGGMELDCPAEEGMSGGPIYDTRQGVVGLVTVTDGRTCAGPCLPRVRDLLRFLLPPYPNRPGLLVPNPWRRGAEGVAEDRPPVAQENPLPESVPELEGWQRWPPAAEPDEPAAGEALAGQPPAESAIVAVVRELQGAMEGLRTRIEEMQENIAIAPRAESRPADAGSTAADGTEAAASAGQAPAIEAAGELAGRVAPWLGALWPALGAGAAGGGGVAVLWLAGRLLLTLLRRKREGGAPAAGEFLAGVPRDLGEAKEYLRLAQLEGRSPVLDALVGRVALDKLDTAIQQSAGPAGDWARQFKRDLLSRTNAMAPMAVYPVQAAS